jgi:hypothetical protein
LKYWKAMEEKDFCVLDWVFSFLIDIGPGLQIYYIMIIVMIILLLYYNDYNNLLLLLYYNDYNYLLLLLLLLYFCNKVFFHLIPKVSVGV